MKHLLRRKAALCFHKLLTLIRSQGGRQETPPSMAPWSGFQTLCLHADEEAHFTVQPHMPSGTCTVQELYL